LLPPEERPCPSCVALLDQLDGATAHAGQRLNFAVVAKAPLRRMLTFAEERGWRHLQLLSSANTPTTATNHGETADGPQVPMLNGGWLDVTVVVGVTLLALGLGAVTLRQRTP
jgi:predicted dithiol-disulfide oxidoreductase (DUF899 family)